jgi:hypothetical protein
LTLGRAAIAVASISLFLLGTMPKCARAAVVDTQIAAFTDDENYALGLATASDKNEKTAAIVIAGPDRTQEEFKPRSAFFSNESQWDELAALWNKARQTQPPQRTNINGDAIKVGQYFDGNALVSVSVNDDATIEFDLIDKDRSPMLFSLRPQDVSDFDSAVKQVSAYFEGGTNSDSGFIFSDSDRRLLTVAELQGLSSEQLRIARNEIYARKGRYFKDGSLTAHFSQFSWYQPNRWDVTLNDIEHANVRLIQSMEK